MLRRIVEPSTWSLDEAPGEEGMACAFRLDPAGRPITLEAPSGRPMSVAPGDCFLGTPGHRESTRWTVGGVPEGGLLPGGEYTVLAESGLVGELAGGSDLARTHLQGVRYLGRVRDAAGATPTVAAAAAAAPGGDAGAPVYLVLGTSAEVGKTTAGLAVLRALRDGGRERIVALKATGTPSLTELWTYRDFGAAAAFDAVDAGLPTTYPSGRGDVADCFAGLLDLALGTPAEAVIVECGGELLGANVPVFLELLRARRPAPTILLAAADALGAHGAVLALERMALRPTLICGPCTDLPTLRARTAALCGIRAANLRQGGLAAALG